MSTYTHRLVEGKFFKYDGVCYKIDKLPSSTKEGTLYRVNGEEFPYYKFTDGKWVGQQTCPYEWRLLTPYTTADRLPQRSSYTVRQSPTDDDLSFMDNLKRSVRTFIYGQPKEDLVYYDSDEDECYEVWKRPNGDEQVMVRHDLWANNGGPIRDEYISERLAYIDVPFRGRGLPNDVSAQTRLAMTDKSNGRLYGYSITWCTIDEWRALYDSEQDRILGKIRDAYENKYHNDVNSKLDFIIDHMKDPMSADTASLRKPTDAERDECDADEDYYDSPQCIIDEEMPNLYSIGYEIGRLEQISSMYGFYGSSNDVRVIYYLA